MATVPGYDAFISYSHQRDRLLGPALQAGLERFAKPWRKLRASRIFIDEANLGASPELWESVQEGLASSRWFILLASDDAARSAWVDREVGWWLEHRSRDRLLIVATSPGMQWEKAEGDWAAAAPVPPALRGAFSAEPLWIDLSDLPPGARAAQLPADRVAAVAAPIRGVPKDTLFGKHLREHRRTMRLAGSAVAMLAVLTASAVAASVIAAGQRDTAINQRDLAEARELLADAPPLAGSQPGLARQYLAQAYRMSDTPLTEGALLTSMAIPRVVTSPSPVLSVAYGGNGAWLALATLQSVLLTDPATGSELGHISFPDSVVYSAVVSPDGHLLAVSADNFVELWQVTDPRHPVRLATITQGGASAAVAFSRDGNTLAAAAHVGPPRHGPGPVGVSRVTLFGLADPARPVPLGGVVVPTPVVHSMAFSADGHTLAIDSGASTALGEVSRAGAIVIAGHAPPAQGLSSDMIAFAPGGHLLALGSLTGSATLWDATNPASPALVASLAGAVGVAGVTFSPDGRTLATVGSGSVVLWNVSAPGAPTTLAKPITSADGVTLAFSPDGSTLATAAGSGVDLWNAPQPASLTEIAARDGYGAYAAITPDSRLLALGDGAGAALWNIAEPQVPRLLSTINPTSATGPGPSIAVLTEHVAIDPGGQVLAIANWSRVSLWSISNPSHPVLLKTIGSKAVINLIAFSPRGHLLAIADGQRIAVWDVADPARASLVRTTTEKPLYALAFSPTGQQLAFDAAGKVWLWTLAGRSAPAPLPVPPGCGLACAIFALAFSPDGHTLAAGTSAGVYLYPQAGQPRQLPGVAGPVAALAFSPDGRFLAIGVGSDTVVWDTSTISAPVQAAILPSAIGTASADMVAFSPDGRFLVTGYHDGTLSIWDTDLADLASRLCRDTGPAISRSEWNQVLLGLPYNPPCQAAR